MFIVYYISFPAWYINFLIGLNGLALLATVFVLNQHHKNPTRPVYKYIRKVVLKSMSKAQVEPAAECNRENAGLLCEGGKSAMPPTGLKNINCVDAANNQENYAEQWACLARLLDRLFFVTYMCVMVFGAVAFLLTTIY